MDHRHAQVQAFPAHSPAVRLAGLQDGRLPDPRSPASPSSRMRRCGPVEPTPGAPRRQGSGQGCAPCDGTGLVGADRLVDVFAAHPLTRLGGCAATGEPTGQVGAQAPDGTIEPARPASAGVRFHDLRHSFAVAQLSARVNFMQVPKWRGHATFAVTLDIYRDFTNQHGEVNTLPDPVSAPDRRTVAWPQRLSQISPTRQKIGSESKLDCTTGQLGWRSPRPV